MANAAKALGDARQLILRLVQHAAEEYVGLLDIGIQPDGMQEGVDGFRKTPKSVVRHAGGQFELRALIEILAAGVERLQRRGEILLP